MTIQRITQEEFDTFDIKRFGYFPEKLWFKSNENNILGTVIEDAIDKDWSYVILAKSDEGYTYLRGEVSLLTINEAERKIYSQMTILEDRENYEETLYSQDGRKIEKDIQISLINIDDEIKGYLKKHPEKLYQLSSRKFEELVASILVDLGFTVELTQATRDGGRDIIAYIRNSVCSYLTHVECKKYSAENKVGVGVIREVVGVHNLRQATKSLIVTTSFFSKDAIEETKKVENILELKDFNNIKNWLQRY